MKYQFAKQKTNQTKKLRKRYEKIGIVQHWGNESLLKQRQIKI